MITSLLKAAEAAATQGARRRAGSALARALDRLAAPGNLFPALTWRGSGGTGALVTSGQADPGGGMGAYSLEDASAAAIARSEMGLVPAPYASGHAVEIEFAVKKDLTATHFPDFRLEYTGGGTHRLELRLDTGQHAVSVGTWERLDVADAGAWWLVRLRQAGEVGPTSLRFSMYPALGPVSGFPAQNVAATGTTTVYGAKVSDPQLTEALRRTLAPGNLLPAPGSITWTAALGTVTTGQADPAGGTDAVILSDTGATNHSSRADIVSYASGNALRARIAIKKEASPTFPAVRLHYSDGTIGQFRLHTGTGVAHKEGGVGDVLVTDAGAWWFCEWTHPGAVASTVFIRVFPAVGDTDFFPTLSEQTGSVTVYGARIEEPALMAALRDTLAPGNLLPGPSYLTWSPVGGAILTTGQADPAGGANAVKIEDTSGGAWQQGRTIDVPYTGGSAVRFSAFIKKDPSAVLAELRLLYSTGKFIRAQIHPATGAVQTWGTPPAEPADEISAIDLGSWWKLTARHSGDALATSVRFDAFPAIQGATNVGAWTIYGARIELL